MEYIAIKQISITADNLEAAMKILSEGGGKPMSININPRPPSSAPAPVAVGGGRAAPPKTGKPA